MVLRVTRLTAEEMYAISKSSLLGSYNAHYTMYMSLEQYKNTLCYVRSARA